MNIKPYRTINTKIIDKNSKKLEEKALMVMHFNRKEAFKKDNKIKEDISEEFHEAIYDELILEKKKEKIRQLISKHHI